MKVKLLSLAAATFLSNMTHAALPAPKDIRNFDLKTYIEKPPEGLVQEKLDTEGKGTHDIIVYFRANSDNSRTQVLQIFDVNRDGKFDLAKHFDKDKVVRSEADLDYDGKVDIVTDYDPETGDVIKKTQVAGPSYIWKYWYKGELRRKELDRNSDGQPDMWVHYRSGKTVKTEIDVNFNGKNIRVEKSLNSDKK